MSDDFRPRKNDALVEPMFEALEGSERKTNEIESEAPRPLPVAFVWALALFGLSALAWLAFEFLV